MDCRESQEHLGDAIDRRLPRAVKKAFYEHLKLCPPCRDEFETETIGKHAVRKFVPHVNVPPSVSRSIVQRLREEARSEGLSESRFDWLLTSRWFRPALATALTVLALVFFLSRPQQAPTGIGQQVATADLIGQIRQNFTLLRSGQLKPALTCTRPETVVGYFREQGVPFAVEVLRATTCERYGAIANDVRGVRLAHVVYEIGGELMYVYQVSKHDAMEGEILTMPQQARASLSTAGWYTDESPDQCSVVLWTSGETLCGAASTMKKDQVLQLLARH